MNTIRTAITKEDVEVFNVTDEPNFSNPTGDMRSPSVLSVGQLFGGGIPRQLQVGVRLGF